MFDQDKSIDIILIGTWQEQKCGRLFGELAFGLKGAVSMANVESFHCDNIINRKKEEFSIYSACVMNPVID
jgi:hypothetical protein